MGRMVINLCRGLITMLALLTCTSSIAAPRAFPITLIPGAFPDDRGPDGNTIIFEDAHGLIVVDTGRHKAHQQAILDFASAHGKPVVAIVNTHWHLDHSGGNQELRAVYPAAKLYTSKAVYGALDHFLAKALENSRKKLADPSLSEADKAEIRLGYDAISDRRDLLPDVPVTGTTRLPYAGRALELHLAPYAATEGDTWVYDPKTRVVAAGDLVVLPLPFFDTACAEGWRHALEVIDRTDFAILYPGHGAILSHADFSLYRWAFDRLLDCANGKAAKQACIDGWIGDAGPLLKTHKERRQSQDYLEHYIEAILRDAATRKAFCGPGHRS
jgi:glyoxylase-like metal-dependent hydrolase (beta-lactamase superfamily II)